MNVQRAAQLLVLFTTMVLGSSIARADPGTTDIAYSTTGWVSHSGFAGVPTPPIWFTGITGTLSDFHSIDLGKFLVGSLPSVTTTFTDTPFQIDFHAPQFDKFEDGPVPSTWTQSYGRFALAGRLNGTVAANGQSSVVATVDSVLTGRDLGLSFIPEVFPVNGLPFGASDVIFPKTIDLSTKPNQFFATVGVSVEVVPEPSSSLVFLLGGSAVGAWRLRRGKRTPRRV